MTRLSTAFLALLLCACAQMPPDVAERVKAIGPVIDPPRTAAIYAPLQQKEPYAGVQVLRDLKYGPDARHALDVFIPEGGGGPRPVLMFVHGGAFVAGNKRAPGSPFYDNVMLWAAGHGLVVQGGEEAAGRQVSGEEGNQAWAGARGFARRGFHRFDPQPGNGGRERERRIEQSDVLAEAQWQQHQV